MRTRGLTSKPGAAARPENDLVTASAAKLAAARLIAGHRAGRLIGATMAKRIRHHGLWFDTRSDVFSPRVRAQMFWGIYEGAETRTIAALLGGSRTVIELGSSLGITGAHIASQLAPSGRLICVEANPFLVPLLRRSLSLRFPNIAVDVIHAAIAGHCGEAYLSLGAQTAGSRVTARTEAAFKVPAITLRELLRQADVSEYDLVSDIEGAEAWFLKRDQQVLAGCKRMVIELHDTSMEGVKVTVPDLLRSARQAGFEVVSQRGPVMGLERVQTSSSESRSR